MVTQSSDEKNTDGTIGMVSAITITAIFLSGIVTAGQIGKVFSQTNENSNMTATMERKFNGGKYYWK